MRRVREGVAAAAPLLTRALRDEEPKVRAEAARALLTVSGFVPREVAEPALLAALGDADGTVRFFAAAAVLRISHDPVAIDRAGVQEAAGPV